MSEHRPATSGYALTPQDAQMIEPQTPTFTPPNPALWVNIPDELLAAPRWFYSTLEPKDDGKRCKAPRHPATGLPVDSGKPENWSTFEEAAHAARRVGGLPGFYLTADPAHGANFAVLDLDDISQEAMDWARKWFKGTFMELSASGRGLHVWLGGRFPGGVRSARVEFYGHERYMLCSGNIGDFGVATIMPATEAQLEWFASTIAPGRSPRICKGAEPGAPDPATTVEMLVAAFRSRKRHTGEFGTGDKTNSGKEWGIAKDLIRAGWPSYAVFHEAWHQLGLGINLARKPDPEGYLERTYCNAWSELITELRREIESHESMMPLLSPKQREDAVTRQHEVWAIICARSPIGSGQAPIGPTKAD